MNKLIIDNGTRMIVELRNNTVVCDDGKRERLLSYQPYNDIDGWVTPNGITEIFASCDKCVTRFTYNGTWHHKDIVSNNQDSGKIKSVKVLTVGLYKNLFYSVQKDGKNMLVHHIKGGGVDKVFAVDYIASRYKYSVFCDNDGNIDIWYINNNDVMCNTKYVWSQKKYFSKQTHGQNVINLCAVPCGSSDAYIAFVRKSKACNEVYFKRASDQNTLMLGFGVGFNCDVAVVPAKNALYVQWSDSKGSAESVSRDYGKTFERPTDIHSIKSVLCNICAYRCAQNYNTKAVDLCISGGKKLLHESAITEILKKETENE